LNFNIRWWYYFFFNVLTVRSELEDDSAYAQQFEAESQHVEEKIISSPDVKIEKLLPRFNDTNIPLGEVGDILIGFINNGNKVFNVTFIRSSLVYLYDNSVFRNFTTYKYDQIVGPHEVASFTYQFVADFSLEPREYGLLTIIQYTDSDNFNYTNTFNYTITLFEPNTEFDMKNLFSYMLGASFFGLIGFVVSKLRTKKSKKGSKGTNQPNISGDWTSDTIAGQFKNQKNKKTKKSVSPPTNKRQTPKTDNVNTEKK